MNEQAEFDGFVALLKSELLRQCGLRFEDCNLDTEADLRKEFDWIKPGTIEDGVREIIDRLIDKYDLFVYP